MLGKYLARQYLPAIPRRYTRAFLFGCTQPDKNPTTYLKGSIRSQFLRGHNWESSQRYMQRLAARLERRARLRLLDFYALGKLIHYTVDAFTFSHNETFDENLKAHRHYENLLEDQFLSYLSSRSCHRRGLGGSTMEAIRSYHSEYENLSSDIGTDCRYSVLAASQVIQMLLAKNGLISPV